MVLWSGTYACRHLHRPTTAGQLDLRIPKLRAGSFFPSLLEGRGRVDQVLFAVVMEAYVHGVPPRKVDDLVKALGADTGISKSAASRICAGLDENVAALRDRPLGEVAFPYVFVDATYCKVSVGRRVVSQAVVVAGEPGQYLGRAELAAAPDARNRIVRRPRGVFETEIGGAGDLGWPGDLPHVRSTCARPGRAGRPRGQCQKSEIREPGTRTITMPPATRAPGRPSSRRCLAVPASARMAPAVRPCRQAGPPLATQAGQAAPVRRATIEAYQITFGWFGQHQACGSATLMATPQHV